MYVGVMDSRREGRLHRLIDIYPIIQSCMQGDILVRRGVGVELPNHVLHGIVGQGTW